MCDVAARCPTCKADLDGRETMCRPYLNRHNYVCYCGAKIEVTMPLPGLVMTRQDAVFKP